MQHLTQCFTTRNAGKNVKTIPGSGYFLLVSRSSISELSFVRSDGPGRKADNDSSTSPHFDS